MKKYILVYAALMMGFSLAKAESKKINDVEAAGSETPVVEVRAMPVKAAEPTPDYTVKAEAAAPAAQDSYPEGASVQSYQQELFEIKKAEETERKAVKARDEYQRIKDETEREIVARKYRIEGLKFKQEQVAAELKTLEGDLKNIEKNYKETESELLTTEKTANEQFAKSDALKSELTQAQKNLEMKIEQLKNLRDSTQVKINKDGIEAQRMRAEVASLEASNEALEAQSANLKSQELQTRTEWTTLKAQIEEKNTEREHQLALLAEAKKKNETVLKDYHVAQSELAAAEKIRHDTEVQVNAEIKRLDQSTYAAQRSKAISEAEKIRIEAETEKFKYYVASVKKTNAEAIEAMKDSQNQVMESRLTLETAKAELGTELSSGERTKSRYEKKAANMRGLASVAESSEMMDGGQPWIVGKQCNIYKRMSSKSDVLGKLTVGQKLVGSSAFGGWVKILNSSGGAAFVKKDCGQF